MNHIPDVNKNYSLGEAYLCEHKGHKESCTEWGRGGEDLIKIKIPFPSCEKKVCF